MVAKSRKSVSLETVTQAAVEAVTFTADENATGVAFIGMVSDDNGLNLSIIGNGDAGRFVAFLSSKIKILFREFAGEAVEVEYDREVMTEAHPDGKKTARRTVNGKKTTTTAIRPAKKAVKKAGK